MGVDMNPILWLYFIPSSARCYEVAHRFECSIVKGRRGLGFNLSYVGSLGSWKHVRGRSPVWIGCIRERTGGKAKVVCARSEGSDLYSQYRDRVLVVRRTLPRERSIPGTE